ncbi:M56 family metallopeptidase [Mariniblastus fucicola]|uniref:Regulatory protein BlaR1 n=1 Tax=Mariniblastus fucicola TaxID=980251 RepID=A0A5B9P841_9BACT|nr:M56 family metallopeptidase [Mariniblastus fucicola]QEG21132.1 Regulatory protein BlaR1 [Mariniblastus fucicola]
MNLLILFACASAVSVIGMLISEVFFRSRLGWFSFSIKATLATTIALPLALSLTNQLSPNGLLQLAILPTPNRANATNIEALNNVSELGPVRILASEFDEQQSSDISPPVVVNPSVAKNGTASLATPQTESNDQATVTPQDYSYDSIPWSQIVSSCWLAGIIFLMARIFAGCWATGKLVKTASGSEPPSWSPIIDEVSEAMQIRSRLTVRTSKKISSPFVVGAIRPRILVPTRMAWSLDKNEIRCVLFHEGAHVKQNDCLWSYVTRIAQALWWPIPMVHWLARRFYQSCEKISDLNVIHRVNPVEYAETLLALATTDLARQPKIYGLTMYPRGSSLESRTQWLFDNATTKVNAPGIEVRRACASALILVFGMCMVVRFVEPQPAALTAAGSTAIAMNTALQEKDSEDRAEVAVDEEAAAAFIGGLILAPDKTPIRGATVYLLKSDGSSSLPKYPAQTNSDEQGRYRFENVSPGNYGVWAESGKFTSLKSKWKSLRLSVSDESKGSDNVDLNLHVGCSYRVKVQSALSGLPVEDARITFGWTDIEREYRTDADGIVLIEGLSPSDWYFMVKANGLATQFRKTSPQKLGHVEELQFDLGPEASLQVSLRDDNGDPVVGAKFWIDPADSGMSPNYESPTTDSNGEFVVKGIPVGQKVRLTTMIDGYDTGSYRATATEAGRLKKVALKCRKTPYGGDVLFKVVDEHGIPIENASIKNRGSGSNLVRQVATDENGEALMQNLYRSIDECSVDVTASGMIGKKFYIVPGTKQKPKNQTIKLVAGGTLTGMIRYPDGKPVPNVTVYYNGGHLGSRFSGPVGATGPIGGRTHSDAEGIFEIAGLPESSTLTVYTPKGYQPINRLPVSVVRGEKNEVQIDLKMEAVIRIRAVDDTTGNAIPNFNVKIDFCRDKKEDDPRSTGGISSTLRREGVTVHGTTKEYVLDHQISGAPYAVIVSAEGYETRKLSRVVAVTRDVSKLLDVKMKPTK